MEFVGALIALALVVYILLGPFIMLGLSHRLRELEKKVREIEAAQRGKRGVFPGRGVTGGGRAAPEAAAVVEAREAVLPAKPGEDAVDKVPRVEPVAAPEPAAPHAEPREPSAEEWDKAAKAEGPGWEPLIGSEASERLKTWLLGGNTLARVGIVILFFGVAFLLKYAVERGWLPIELRLVGAALGGIALLAVGWRLRERRRNYALALQGGGVGIVYLTVFAAVSMYDFIATGPGLVLMVTLVALSSLLALLQDARSLVNLAMLGGFLAPVLISRDGNHVVLFSYYALLNAGILGIAWFKAWRELNLIGFVFTFVIGSAWGYQYYQPAYFATTGPFLLLFFVFYVAVPVLFALRQPLNLRGYVDGSLVFGVPLVALGLQSALVRDFEYGLALSALGAGVFYAGVVSALWHRWRESMRPLIEVFLALAVAFGTLAIPLAVDGRWTGAAWALEGAALVWIGVRQRRLLARLFGLLVQVGAGVAFLTEIGAPTADVLVLNSVYMSALMVSFSGLFTAYYLYRHQQVLTQQEAPVSMLALAWGLGWWFGAAVNEIMKHIVEINRESAVLGFVAASLAVVAALRRRLDWPYLAFPALGLLPVMIVTALIAFAGAAFPHPFANWGWGSWTIAFVVQFWLLWRLEADWFEDVAPFWHAATFWLAAFLVTWEVAWAVRQAVPNAPTWPFVTWALVPSAVIFSLPWLESTLTWPVQRFKTSYLGLGALPLVVAQGIWIVHASTQRGDPWPLPYLPVLNPLELTQCLVLIVLLLWSGRAWLKIPQPWRWYAWSTVAFVALNGMIARAIHHLAHVPLNALALWSSPTFQSMVSITWTVVALSIMVTATRLKQRTAWIAGSALLGTVVVKLFLVDLADIGTLARIVSFIVVGLLILLVGYLSPLPPRTRET